MSSSQKTFVDRVLDGEALPEDIDDYVDAWHDSPNESRPLQEFLGFSSDEYALWIEKPDTLSWIFMCRSQGIRLDTIDWEETHQLAARAKTEEESEKLIAWLEKTGRL